MRAQDKTLSSEAVERLKEESMKDQYHINLEEYSLNKFKNNLKSVER